VPVDELSSPGEATHRRVSTETDITRYRISGSGRDLRFCRRRGVLSPV